MKTPDEIVRRVVQQIMYAIYELNVLAACEDVDEPSARCHAQDGLDCLEYIAFMLLDDTELTPRLRAVRRSLHQRFAELSEPAPRTASEILHELVTEGVAK